MNPAALPAADLFGSQPALRYRTNRRGLFRYAQLGRRLVLPNDLRDQSSGLRRCVPDRYPDIGVLDNRIPAFDHRVSGGECAVHYRRAAQQKRKQ